VKKHVDVQFYPAHALNNLGVSWIRH